MAMRVGGGEAVEGRQRERDADVPGPAPRRRSSASARGSISRRSRSAGFPPWRGSGGEKRKATAESELGRAREKPAAAATARPFGLVGRAAGGLAEPAGGPPGRGRPPAFASAPVCGSRSRRTTKRWTTSPSRSSLVDGEPVEGIRCDRAPGRPHRQAHFAVTDADLTVRRVVGQVLDGWRRPRAAGRPGSPIRGAAVPRHRGGRTQARPLTALTRSRGQAFRGGRGSDWSAGRGFPGREDQRRS